jgi:hypothetical protein
LNMRVEIDVTVEEVLARADTGHVGAYTSCPALRNVGVSFRQTTLPAQLPCTRTNVAIASSPHSAARLWLAFSVRGDSTVIAGPGMLEQDRHRSQVGGGRCPSVPTPCLGCGNREYLRSD